MEFLIGFYFFEQCFNSVRYIANFLSGCWSTSLLFLQVDFSKLVCHESPNVFVRPTLSHFVSNVEFFNRDFFMADFRPTLASIEPTLLKCGITILFNC